MCIVCFLLFTCAVFSAGRVSLVRISTLRLERLQLEDQGSYDCGILLLNKAAEEQKLNNWTRLSVMGEVLLHVSVFSSDRNRSSTELNTTISAGRQLNIDLHIAIENISGCCKCADSAGTNQICFTF